jgi:hypothetical protein
MACKYIYKGKQFNNMEELRVFIENTQFSELLSKQERDSRIEQLSKTPEETETESETNEELTSEIVDVEGLSKEEARLEMIESLSNEESEPEYSKDIIHNELLDIHLSVLSNPSEKVQKQITKPLDFGDLDSLAGEYSSIKGTDMFSGLSPVYQRDKYLGGQAGKVGIGVFSIDSVFNASIQGKNVTLNAPTFKIAGVTGSKDLSDPYTIATRKMIDSGELTNEQKSKIKYKSDVIAAYQSAAVDNENEQLMDKLNINNGTFSAIRIMNQMGFSEQEVVALLMQPIVVDFVTKLNENSDSFSEFKTRTAIQEATIKLLTGSKPKNILPLQGKYYNGSKFEMNERDNDYSSSLTLNELKQQLTTFDTTEQQKLLKMFIKLTELGDELKEIQLAVNSDSSGVPKSVIDVSDKVQKIGSLVFNDTFRGAHKIIGDYITENELNELPPSERLEYTKVSFLDKGRLVSKYIKPNTIKGFAAIHATTFSNDIFSRFFPFDSYGFNSVVNEIELYQNGSMSAKKKKKIWKDMKKYFNSIVFSNKPSSRRVELMTKIDGDSLATRLNQYAETSNNPFVSKLIAFDRKSKASKITFDAFTSLNNDDSNIYAGFIDLVNDNKELADDLVEFAFLNGGVQGGTEFVKYIPISYFTSTEKGRRLSKINFGDIKSYMRKGQIQGVSAFTIQYFQHYPWEIREEIPKSNVNGTIKDTFELKKEYVDSLNAQGKQPDTFFSGTDSKSIYVRESNNSLKYIKLPVVGEKSTTHYDASKQTSESIVNEILKKNREERNPQEVQPYIEQHPQELSQEEMDFLNSLRSIPTPTQVPSSVKKTPSIEPNVVPSSDGNPVNDPSNVRKIKKSDLGKSLLVSNNYETVNKQSNVKKALQEIEGSTIDSYSKTAKALNKIVGDNLKVEYMSGAKLLDRLKGKGNQSINNGDQIYGYAQGDTIFINENKSQSDIEHTILHETIHLLTVDGLNSILSDKDIERNGDIKDRLDSMIEQFNDAVKSQKINERTSSAKTLSNSLDTTSQEYLDNISYAYKYINDSNNTPLAKYAEFISLVTTNPSVQHFANEITTDESFISNLSELIKDILKIMGVKLNNTILTSTIKSVIEINSIQQESSTQNNIGNAVSLLADEGYFDDGFEITKEMTTALETAVELDILSPTVDNIKAFYDSFKKC